jgi:hypothetical protein
MLPRTACFVLALILVGTNVASVAAVPFSNYATVIQPVTAVATSNFGGRIDIKTVNGVGLSLPALVTTGSPVPLIWPTHDNLPDNGMWHTNNVNPGEIVFDLGQIYNDVRGFHVWNYNENSTNPTFYTQRGMQNVTVDFSTVSAAGPFTDPIVYSGATAFLQADGSNTIPGEDKLLPVIATRWIRFIGFRFTAAEGYTGLSEVRFVNDPQIPEPSTFALLGLGIAGLAVRARRRRTAR